MHRSAGLVDAGAPRSGHETLRRDGCRRPREPLDPAGRAARRGGARPGRASRPCCGCWRAWRSRRGGRSMRATYSSPPEPRTGRSRSARWPARARPARGRAAPVRSTARPPPVPRRRCPRGSIRASSSTSRWPRSAVRSAPPRATRSAPCRPGSGPRSCAPWTLTTRPTPSRWRIGSRCSTKAGCGSAEPPSRWSTPRPTSSSPRSSAGRASTLVPGISGEGRTGHPARQPDRGAGGPDRGDLLPRHHARRPSRPRPPDAGWSGVAGPGAVDRAVRGRHSRSGRRRGALDPRAGCRRRNAARGRGGARAGRSETLPRLRRPRRAAGSAVAVCAAQRVMQALRGADSRRARQDAQGPVMRPARRVLPPGALVLVALAAAAAVVPTPASWVERAYSRQAYLAVQNTLTPAQRPRRVRLA